MRRFLWLAFALSLTPFTGRADVDDGPPPGILKPYDGAAILPYLAQDKETFVEALLAQNVSTQNGQILRAYLLSKVICNIRSDAALKGCDDLMGSEELDGQSFKSLNDFNFDQNNLALVKQSLDALLQGAKLSLNSKENANQILTAVRTAGALSLQEAANQIAEAIKTHSALREELKNSPDTQPFVTLYSEITDWLESRPSCPEPVLKGPPWQIGQDASDWHLTWTKLFYRISSRGALVALIAEQYDGEARPPRPYSGQEFQLPIEVKNAKVKEFLTSEGNNNHCVKTWSDQYLCWGDAFYSEMKKEVQNGVNTTLDPLTVWVAEQKPMNQYALGDAKGEISAPYSLCFNHTPLEQNWLLFSRGRVQIFGALDAQDPHHIVCMGQRFSTVIPRQPVNTGSIAIPAGAHDLTVYHGRLYYVSANGDLHSEGRFEKTPSMLAAYGLPQKNILQLQANDRYLCLLVNQHGWVCFVEGGNGIRHFDTFGSDLAGGQMLLQGPPMLVNGKAIQAGWREISERNDFGGFNYAITLPSGTSRFVFVPAEQEGAGSFCYIQSEKVQCQWGSQDQAYPLSTFFPDLKNVTELLIDGGRTICALNGTSATCLDTDQYAYYAPRGRKSEKKQTLDPILASPALPTIKADKDGICKMLKSQVRCLIGDTSPIQSHLVDDIESVDARISTTAFSLPAQEPVLHLANQAELCFESQNAVRCYDTQGNNLQTYVLQRQVGQP